MGSRQRSPVLRAGRVHSGTAEITSTWTGCVLSRKGAVGNAQVFHLSNSGNGEDWGATAMRGDRVGSNQGLTFRHVK